MDRNKPRHSGRVNSAVSFDLNLFARKLVRALDPKGISGIAGPPELPSGGSISLDWLSCGPDIFGVNYLVSSIFSKYDDGKPSEEKRVRTWEKFMQAERECQMTNWRVQDRVLSYTSSLNVHSVLHVAERKIHEVLGSFCWHEALDGMGWGPGATFSRPRRKSDAIYKFDGNVVTTVGNSGIAAWVINQTPLWQEGLLSEESSWTYVPGNRVCTVPKNYKTDRTIAIEPDMNIYVQKGIGAMIRQRLRRIGIDLNSQQENQNMAFLGSYFDNLATVDLSMASDTISLEIVRQLIPSDWLQALEQARSPYGRLPSGVWLEYQKFSSMGNGYTFELESLIFWALSSATLEIAEVKGSMSVYGDDIIVPTAMAEPLINVLREVGFVPNQKKSFWSGPFRESCGKHYFLGHDVTPFYVRRPVSSLAELFLLHNNLYRWLCRVKWAKVGKMQYRGTWETVSRPITDLLYPLVDSLRELAPSNWRRPRIPDGFGDGAFIGTFDEALPTLAKRGWEGYTVHTLDRVPLRSEFAGVGRLLSSLDSVEKIPRLFWCDEFDSSPVRGERFVVRKHHVPQWALVDPRNID